MKKVIDGKVYDTETATLKAEWENMYDARNFNYVEEQLYQKKTGEFFLYGYGGLTQITPIEFDDRETREYEVYKKLEQYGDYMPEPRMQNALLMERP